jgi:hypothetical protein
MLCRRQWRGVLGSERLVQSSVRGRRFRRRDRERWTGAAFRSVRPTIIRGSWNISSLRNDNLQILARHDEADEPVDAIYAPALLTFFTAADTCAWVPLGPDEAYVPPYPVPLRYCHRINAPFVRDIRTRDRIATEKTTISAREHVEASGLIVLSQKIFCRSPLRIR